MIQRPKDTDRVWEWIDAVCTDDVSPEDTRNLQERLRNDPTACDLYNDYCDLHAALLFRAKSEESFEAFRECFQELPPAITYTSTIATDAFRYLPQNLVLSYLIAVILVGASLLIGSRVYVDHPQPLADDCATQRPHIAATFVAHITGMVDCRWQKGSRFKVQDFRLADYQSEVGSRKYRVALGDRFVLTSGLVEITYDSDAKVILQGPVTYEVDSAVGGFLSLGKLTARVEKMGEGEEAVGHHSPMANELESGSSPSLGPLFTIRTPTAVVSDLGTEFGVEVDKHGNTHSHVFQGVVEVQTATERDGSSVPLRLTKNESVEVIQQPNKELKIQRTTVVSTQFVLSAQMQSRMVEQQANTSLLKWPILDKTLIAWVALDNLNQRGVGVVSMFHMPEFDGIVFGELAPKKWMGGSHVFDRTEQDQSAYPVETAGPEEFVQIAIVYDRTLVTLYRNGKPYSTFDAGNCRPFYKDLTVMMGKRHPDYPPTNMPETLAGRIEEVRIYAKALSVEEIRALKPKQPSTIAPLGWWTFENGEPREETGHFPMGELRGNAHIADGKLILDGHGSYLFVPSPVNQTKK